MEGHYYSPKSPASFTSASAIKKSTDTAASLPVIQNWLNDQETYSIHRPVKRKFRRRRVVVSGIDDQWQADLADLSNRADQNDGYKFLLGCIDVFSKYAWVVPLKTKSAREVLRGLKSILENDDERRRPRTLQTDKGTEFTNREVQAYLKREKIGFFTTENEETKAQIVERFWRTLKGRMFKYFTYKKTDRYVDVLDDLVHSYNHTYHRSIKMKPAEVREENEAQVHRTLYPVSEVMSAVGKFKKGDYVRIS